MKGATTKLGLALVMEHHPSLVLVEPCTFPLEWVIWGRRPGSNTHEHRQKVHCTVEGVEDWPRHLLWKQREQVLRVKWGFQGQTWRPMMRKVLSNTTLQSKDGEDEEEAMATREGGTRRSMKVELLLGVFWVMESTINN